MMEKKAQMKSEQNGLTCYHHPAEPAAARCVRCGKFICKDCAEAYGVTSGEYRGKCLCFDCCEQMVEENIAELTMNKNIIKKQFILQVIGMAIGFIFGMDIGVSFGGVGNAFLVALVVACIGGVFLSALKVIGSLTWEAIKIAFAGEFGVITVVVLFFSILFIIAKCIWRTTTNTIYYIVYLKRTAGFIEADASALNQMRDYMKYTHVRSQNSDVALDSLMNEGGALYNNLYAQAVREYGEQAADAALRQATTEITENGDAIKKFHSVV